MLIAAPISDNIHFKAEFELKVYFYYMGKWTVGNQYYTDILPFLKAISMKCTNTLKPRQLL